MGSGQQFFSWIHLQDIARLFEFAVENQNVDGVLNGVAPHPVRYTEFNDVMGRAVHRPAFFWVPSMVAKLTFGERSSLFLEGAKLLPKRTQEMGFKFDFEFIEEALKDVVTNKS
jgi:uncharacterized protein